MSNVNNILKNKIIFMIALVQFSCIMEIQEIDIKSFKISDFIVDYDQELNELFFQVSTEAEYDTIVNVQVQMLANNPTMEMIFTLNDSAKSGDLIAMNGVFSGNFSLEEALLFREYQINAIVQNNSGEETTKLIIFNIEEEFSPEVVEIKFWKKYADGSGYFFDPAITEFQVNDDELSYLDIQVEIKDLNGLEDIKSIRYQINVEGMSAEDSCDYVSELGFQNYVQWYLDFQSQTDSTFIFDINNSYLPEPGIIIKSLASCGRTGVSIFRFIVSDYFHDPISIEIPLAFIKCGDNLWDCNVEDESGYCIEECPE